jgi:hypothetical protein
MRKVNMSTEGKDLEQSQCGSMQRLEREDNENENVKPKHFIANAGNTTQRMLCSLVLSAVLFQRRNSVFLSQQISKQFFSACLFSEDICRKFFFLFSE